jgi:hypothetical protein
MSLTLKVTNYFIIPLQLHQLQGLDTTLALAPPMVYQQKETSHHTHLHQTSHRRTQSYQERRRILSNLVTRNIMTQTSTPVPAPPMSLQMLILLPTQHNPLVNSIQIPSILQRVTDLFIHRHIQQMALCILQPIQQTITLMHRLMWHTAHHQQMDHRTQSTQVICPCVCMKRCQH